MSTEEAYILGTDKEELHRLGLQHQVWASEAQEGWRRAGFSAGHHILDLGSGPGFCSRELAYITGEKGQVTAIDRSENYIRFLEEMARSNGLSIDSVHATFDEMELQANSLDGMYCRWALAWVPNPGPTLEKVHDALKPGGRMVIHEYYDWTTHQCEPRLPHLSHAISRCYASFKEQEGDIDIGRHLPKMLADMGMKVISTRPMSKMARPADLTWQWPATFYNIYFPKLVEMGYLTEDEVNAALQDHRQLSKDPNATLCCPLVVEVIAEKV